MSEIYQAVKNVIIFLLLVTVLSNLIGHSSFKKYIDIFVGLVLIIIVITPILNIINSEEKVNHYYNQNVYKFSASDMSEELMHADSDYQKTILKQYKESIEQQIKEQLKQHELQVSNMDIEINEDVESDECGAVLSMEVEAVKQSVSETNGESSLEIDEIDQVIIDKVDINNEEKMSKEAQAETKDEYDTVEELTVKEELGALYGLSEDNIKVSITQ